MRRDVAIIALLCVVLCSSSLVVGLPTQNVTVEVPKGTSNHGDPHLLCTPAIWSDILIFYAGNYVLHAATVKPYPGESRMAKIMSWVSAILFPLTGVTRGINSIVRCSMLMARTPLQRAARSGALAMVVRSEDWKPATGDTARLWLRRARQDPTEGNAQPEPHMRNAEDGSRIQEPINCKVALPYHLTEVSQYWCFLDTIAFYTTGRIIHGSHRLPEGYEFAFVPGHAIISELENASPEIASSYSFLRAGVALFQSIFTSIGLYRARGDQIQRYGYAAFGLTVAPYAVMSVLNLIGSLLTPEYPSLYLVDSEVMDEAKRRGGRFDYVVGRITTPVDDTQDATTHGDWVQVSGSFEVQARDMERLRVLFHQASSSSARLLSFPTVRHELSGLEAHRQSALVSAGPKLERRNSANDREVTRFYKAEESLVQDGVMSVLTCVIGGITLGIVGGLSGFRNGGSTYAQRIWTMVWLVFGNFIGANIVLLSGRNFSSLRAYRTIRTMVSMPYERLRRAGAMFGRTGTMLGRAGTMLGRAGAISETAGAIFDTAGAMIERVGSMIERASAIIEPVGASILIHVANNAGWALHVVFAVTYGAPAIGGFVIVSQMLWEYGNCYRFA